MAGKRVQQKARNRKEQSAMLSNLVKYGFYEHKLYTVCIYAVVGIPQSPVENLTVNHRNNKLAPNSRFG